MKNPHTKQKVKDYGALTTHLCGSHSEILIPKQPTINSKEYVFMKNKMVDYLGSYHITITLPHTKDILKKDFVKMHQNMAQQIQWIEPLFITSFFSPTQDSVANQDEPEGSFRVMTIGWGNFAGSDIRKMGNTGLDRGSNIKSLWRRGLNFKGTKQLNECVKTAKPQYKKSKSIHTGDFRTFGQELDIEKCNKLYNPSDCINGRADGKPMEPPFGMEIRIFDHFPSEYFIDLFRIVILIGCNSQRHPAKEYVYKEDITVVGNAQRNYALTKVTNPDTLLYYLDDDNIIHPNLYRLLTIIDNTKIYTFNQYNGLKGNNIKLNLIDTAMFIIPYKSCKNIKWILNAYNADGFYIMECYDKNIAIYVDNDLCYYNKISV
jgi:hypothetical protein